MNTIKAAVIVAGIAIVSGSIMAARSWWVAAFAAEYAKGQAECRSITEAATSDLRARHIAEVNELLRKNAERSQAIEEQRRRDQEAVTELGRSMDAQDADAATAAKDLPGCMIPAKVVDIFNRKAR